MRYKPRNGWEEAHAEAGGAIRTVVLWGCAILIAAAVGGMVAATNLAVLLIG